MNPRLSRYFGAILVILGLAALVLVFYPLPDPLFGKNRVFIDWGFSVLPEDWRARLSGELAVEVAGRAITWVLNPSAAEVILVLREFRVASEAEFVSAGTGRVSLAFVATEAQLEKHSGWTWLSPPKIGKLRKPNGAPGGFGNFGSSAGLFAQSRTGAEKKALRSSFRA